MFKLESYITPILLEYVSKYVKNIRQEDFQLSLWEGEVALHNLDLRLDVLQEELNLPVEFISGHIHDLSIRVPWTKITSEPITITINTIEFVLKLKSQRTDGAGSSAASSPQRLHEAKKKRKCPPKPDDRSSNPEASSSWIVSKIINNISLQCHNIILKYVQEDIVVSMNVQLMSFESANEKWESAMIDVHPIKVLMRKLVKISDLTICLDKRNAAGQIDVCQEPILYRSSLACRILLKYNANNPESNRITRIGVHTSLLDMNISSMQIPLCMRLIKLLQTFKDFKTSKVTPPDTAEECDEEDVETPADQSYLSWAWSKLPSINFTPGYEDEPTNEAPCHTIDIGFYAEELSFTIKNAEFVTETLMTATKRIRYSPIVRMTIGGVYFEMVSAPVRHWNSMKAGVTSVCVEPLGVYKTGNSKLVESTETLNQRPFIDKSLFDCQCLIADKGGVTNFEEYTTRITDDYLLYRSPVLAFDLIQYKTDMASTGTNNSGNEEGQNRVQYRLLSAGLTFRYTQTLDQVKHLISEFINSYDYPAYYTESLDGGGLHNAGNTSKLPPPLMEDYDALMRHIPLCTYKFSIQKITFEIHAKSEQDNLAQKSQLRRVPSVSQKTGALAPICVISIISVEGSLSTPLYPDKLVHTTCQLPDKPQKLFEACYENYEMQLKEFTCSLVNELENRNAPLLHIPNFKISYGKLLQPQNWKDDTIEFRKLSVNCEDIYLKFTRRELSSMLYLAQCAYKYHPHTYRRLIRQEASDLTVDDNTRLHNSASGLQVRWIFNTKQNIWNCSLYSFESTVVFKERYEITKQVVLTTVVENRQSDTESVRWLECSIQFPQGKEKTLVGFWLAPFRIKVDANLIQFLRCRKFEELERETGSESVIQMHILSIPQNQSNSNLPLQQPHKSSGQISQAPQVARRSSRTSVQSRKVSHPEETIHVSSERDEKMDRDASTASVSPKLTDTEQRSPFLSFLKNYILCIEIEPGTISIAEDLKKDPMITKIILPRVLLKPSNMETVKYTTLRQMMVSMSMSPKDKTNISWTMVLSDFSIINDYGNSSEALLESIQTTITIALMYKSEKVKILATEIKEENEPQSQSDKSPIQKELVTPKPTGPTQSIQMSRSISPGEEMSSQASVTVGGRSEKSFTEPMQSEVYNIQTPLGSSKSIGKQNLKRIRKNRDIYTFNLHADTTPIRFVVSSRKIRIFEEHLRTLIKVIKLSTPITQPNDCKEIPEERIEIVTATEENITLKEFMDLETNSESSKLSEKEKDSQLAVSFFCQWTITRITLEIEANPLNYQSSKVVIDLEDLLSTIDQRDDYTKFTSKVGNFNVNYFEESLNGDWIANDCLTIRLMGDTTNLPFLNVIFTSVELKQFLKRIGAKRKGDLNRCLKEIIVTVQALEVIVDLERISNFVAAVSGFFERCSQPPNKNELNSSILDANKNISKPIAAIDLPMIHLDSKGFTLYMPLNKAQDCCSVAIFKIQNIKITPNLENPLQRKPLRSDVYGKAAQLGMLATPGAMIEDRQYELTLKNISAASGSWRLIQANMSEQRDNFFRTNPAVEWNNQNRKPELHLTNIFNNFSFVAIYAPSIVYQNVLICGSVIEFNCATDFVASLNMHQINMLSCLIIHLNRISCFVENSKKRKRVTLSTKQTCSSLNAMLKQTSNNTTLMYSRSSKSTGNRCSSIALTSLRDVRNSSVFNSIDEDVEQILLTSDSGFQSCNSNILSKERFGSLSTISSAPITQPRHIPQTISLVAGVFLIKFYDAQISNNTEKEQLEESCHLLRTPLFSITLSQPSFMFTQNVYDSVTQISLYDLYIYLATPNHLGPQSLLVFNEIILDTRPGQANAAGITPPLFSLRSHSTKMELCECDIEIAKPIALPLTEEKVQLLCRYILLINATLLEDPCFQVRPERTIIRGSKIRLMRRQLFEADRLHLNIRGIVVRFQNENETYNCKLVSSEMKLNVKFLNRPEKATTKASIGALYLLVDQKAVIHPLNIRLSVDIVSEPWHQLPLITAIIKLNTLQFDIGINSVKHLEQACRGYERLTDDLSLQWKEFLRNRPYEKESTDQRRNLEPIKCPSACDLSSQSSRTSMQRDELYQDDLRAGAFQFVEMQTDTFLPMPYQIQIIKKNFGIICWRYPHPRKMSKIEVNPIPMPKPVHIRCRMEYYSEAHETFLHYCDFSLSETNRKRIQLPERQVCAHIWRVVILQSLITINGACFDDMLSEDEESQKSIASIKIDDILKNERKDSDFFIEPKLLVGCMQIDTIFESTCVPKIQLLLGCNFVIVRLVNQPNEGSVLPKLLKKYKLVQTSQISQTFLIASLQNLNMHASLVSSENYSINSNVSCNIKCLDYGFLNMLTVLEDTTIQSSISVTTNESNSQRDVELKFVLDRFRLNLGPSIVHSLLTSKSHWEDYLQSETKRQALVPKCIVVNRTYTHLTFGQTGTIERIQLQNKESCLYSFASHYHAQELTFFMTDAETEMTEASKSVSISFKYSGDVLVQPVRIGKKCLLIKSRKLSQMQIYVLIKGQIELVSMVPNEFRLDFRRGDSKTGNSRKSLEYHIEARERACFYYSVQQTSNLSMRLRFVDNNQASKSRSGDIPLRSNKNLPWLVKVPHMKLGFISFWVRVFREDITELCTEKFIPQRILITIWPIFEICSMLVTPTKATEETTRASIEILPEGNIQTLDVPATHLTDHRVKFDFKHPISSKSKDEFMLTLKMLDWNEFFKYDEQKWSIENVLNELGKGNPTKFPCNDEEELRVTRNFIEPECPAIQYSCMPSRQLSCTLRLEVASWGYLINESSFDVSIRNATTKEHLVVDSNSLQMLFAIEQYFLIEVANGTDWLGSAPIYFENTGNTTNSGSKYYVLSEKSHTEIVILRGDQVITFILDLKIERTRRILTVRSKFVITNFTKHNLCLLPVAMDHKEQAAREHLSCLDSNTFKCEVPPLKSRDDCVGVALDAFHDLYAAKSKRTIDTAFVFFVAIKCCNGSEVTIPIPLSMPFTRRCFSAQYGKDSLALAVTLIEQNGIYYLSVFNDNSPALLINNHTDIKFIIAQTNATEHSKVTNTTAEYIGRHFEWFQYLLPYSNCYYTPPEMYANFPDVESTMCNLTLAIYKDNLSKKDIKWSKPLRTDQSLEKFLHIPNHGDVKIIICDKHRIVRVSISYILQQKEFSVKDLRSRLLTTQPTAIDSNDSISSLTAQPNTNITNVTDENKFKDLKLCAHKQADELTKKTLKTHVKLHAYAKEIILCLNTDNPEHDYLKTEVLCAYIDDFVLVYNDSSLSKAERRTLRILLPNLQIDNRLHSSERFDFPVIICAQEPYQRITLLPQAHNIDCIYNDLLDRSPMVSLSFDFFDDEMVISDINCSFSPLRAYIEDAYLNELLDAFVECLPSNCVYTQKTTSKRILLNDGFTLVPRDIAAQAICIGEPFQLRSFRIEPLSVLLSVHTSLRLYIALDHSPLSFSSYERQQIVTVPLRFGQSLGMHYLSGAIFGAGWVVGSLEILGSPSGLARSFTTGLRDFVAMPVQGLFRGPWGFIVGITQGSASLLRNVTAGTVNSLTKLAASVARNLDRLSLDREHIERTEALRRVHPNSLTEGLSLGITALGISILGAVGGIAHHTLEARSPAEVVTGVGKGFLGAFTKPISGAAELVALTGQGVLQTVGFNALPQQRVQSVKNNQIYEPSAYRIWKLLPTLLPTDQVLFYHEITLAADNQLRSAYAFLTSTFFAILLTEWDKLEFAFPVHKVLITRDRGDKTLFYVRFTKDDADELEDSLSYTNERIMNFLQSSYSIRESLRFSTGSLQEMMNEEHDTMVSENNLDWAFYINEHIGEHLMQYLKILRNEN